MVEYSVADMPRSGEGEAIRQRSKLSFYHDCLQDDTLALRLDVRIHLITNQDGKEESVVSCGWMADPRLSIPPASSFAEKMNPVLLPALYEYLGLDSHEEEEEKTERPAPDQDPMEFIKSLFAEVKKE